MATESDPVDDSANITWLLITADVPLIGSVTVAESGHTAVAQVAKRTTVGSTQLLGRGSTAVGSVFRTLRVDVTRTTLWEPHVYSGRTYHY
jgi:hypothetical protein